MSALEIFHFHDHELRVHVDNAGDPWFVAGDVARILGYGSAKDLARRLEEDEKGGRPVPTAGGEQVVLMISMPGLFNAISQRQTGRIPDPADREMIARFKRTVNHVILPSIFKTGRFEVAPAPRQEVELPGTYLDALKALVSTVERAESAEARNAELEPKAAFADGFLAAKGDWCVRQAAHMLNRDPSINTGEIRLFRHIRGIKWISKDNTPLQKARDAGFVDSQPGMSWKHPKTGERMAGGLQARITVKGMFELHRQLGGTSSLVLDAPDDHAVPAQLALLPGGVA